MNATRHGESLWQTIRAVELHGAEWPDDYDDLHEALAEIGFTPCVYFKGGGSNKLPRGFYFARGLDDDNASVAKKVFNVADEMGYENEVVVIKSGGSRSSLSSDCDTE